MCVDNELRPITMCFSCVAFTVGSHMSKPKLLIVSLCICGEQIKKNQIKKPGCTGQWPETPDFIEIKNAIS